MTIELDEDLEEMLHDVGISIEDECEDNEQTDEFEDNEQTDWRKDSDLHLETETETEEDDTEAEIELTETANDVDESDDKDRKIQIVRVIEAEKGEMNVVMTRKHPTRLDDEVEAIRRFESRGFSVTVNGIKVTESSPCKISVK